MATSPEDIAGLLTRLDTHVVSGLRQVSADILGGLAHVAAAATGTGANKPVSKPAKEKTDPGPSLADTLLDAIPDQLHHAIGGIVKVLQPLTSSFVDLGKVLKDGLIPAKTKKTSKTAETQATTQTEEPVLSPESLFSQLKANTQEIYHGLGRMLAGKNPLEEAQPANAPTAAPAQPSTAEAIQERIPVSPQETPEGLGIPPKVGKATGAAAEAGAGEAGEVAGAAAGAGEAAEAGGAAAAGGEAAAGAGVAGALASNPVGWAIAAAGAVAAVVAALVELPSAVTSFGESLLESQRSLAQVSPSMAAVFAKADMQDTFRNMDIGEQTSGSAGDLSDSLQGLKDGSEDLVVLLTNIKNEVGAVLINLIKDYIIPPVTQIVTFVAEILRWLGLALDEIKKVEDPPLTMGQWLIDIEKETKAMRDRNDPRFNRPVFG
jgi:hypothetical protein